MNKVLNFILIGAASILTGLGIYYFESLKNLSDQLASADFSAREVSSQQTNAVQDSSLAYEVVEVARGLFVPWSIAFTSENRFLVTERNGYIKEVINDKLNSNPLIKFADVRTSSEEGLMGLAVDPNYEENKYLYACYAYTSSNGLADKIVRLIDNDDSIEIDQILIDRIPAASNHAGCRLKFGPDEKLYITTGDATDANTAQDINSLGGKVLRINKDGTIPANNPFFNSLVYTLGHRNPQGIDWTANGIMLLSEHGPSGFDGPPGGDEINKIQESANYGWPEVSHQETDPKYITPLQVFTPAIAPASLMVYKSDLMPQFMGDVFIGGLRGEGLYKLSFSNNQYNEVVDVAKIAEVDFGRIREVVESPNGEIYITTSNRDGRGTLRTNDDKIYKITLKN